MLQLHRSASVEPHRSRRGAVAKGCLIGVAVLLLLAVVLGMTLMGKYNGLARGQENVRGRWAEIDNQYKRRFDLVPNLVATVKGAADFEKSTLESVTQARASVEKAQLPGNVPTDPEQLKAYMQAQQGLSGALRHLFAVSENYPQLRATQNFLALQDQIEGTENRIGTARRDYIDAVQSFNTSTATFPSNVIAGMFGFHPLPQLEMPVEERAVPKVDFGVGDGKK